MITRIRLVNPTRKPVLEARIEVEYGDLVARTEDCRIFTVFAIQEGKEFFAGRSFNKKELATWLAGELVHPDQRQLSDILGNIPAIAPNPQSWRWYFIGGRGEERLKDQFKPTTADLQKLAGLALQIDPKGFYPISDFYEIWICNKDTELPLFLAMTGNSLKEIDRQAFSPLWRFALWLSNSQTEVPLRNLRDTINQQVNASDDPRKVCWKHRLFRRNLDGTAIEYAQDSLEPVAEYPVGWLPEGLMAEPFETIRRELEQFNN